MKPRRLQNREAGSPPRWWRGPLQSWVFAAFAVYAAFLLVTEHRAHAFDILLYGFTSLCVLVLLLNGMHAGVEEEEQQTTDQERLR